MTKPGSRFRSYGPVLEQPLLRRILPGMAVSALGDGMSMVAVAWLAVQIAPAGQAAAGPASRSPRTPCRRRSAPRCSAGSCGGSAASTWSRSTPRCGPWRSGTIAVLAVAGRLGPAGYVSLLAVSSLLHAWGSAGTYTLVAELLPDRHHLAGNALLSTFNQAAFVVGPALAGADQHARRPGLGHRHRRGELRGAGGQLRDRGGPARRRDGADRRTGADRDPAATDGWRIVLREPRLLGLLAVTCVFFFLYGPVEVALPIYVAHDLHGSPGAARRLLDRVRHRGGRGRAERRSAPRPPPLRRRRRHRHRVGRRPAADRADQRRVGRPGRAGDRRPDLRPVHRDLRRTVPTHQPAARAHPRARHPHRRHHPRRPPSARSPAARSSPPSERSPLCCSPPCSPSHSASPSPPRDLPGSAT